MESLACGEIGLSIDEFYNLTPAQFYNLQTGYFKKVERNLETQWMQTKVVCYNIYLSIPTAKKNSKMGFEKYVNTFFNAKEKLKPVKDLSKEAQHNRATEMFKKIDKLKIVNSEK